MQYWGMTLNDLKQNDRTGQAIIIIEKMAKNPAKTKKHKKKKTKTARDTNTDKPDRFYCQKIENHVKKN